MERAGANQKTEARLFRKVKLNSCSWVDCEGCGEGGSWATGRKDQAKEHGKKIKTRGAAEQSKWDGWNYEISSLPLVQSWKKKQGSLGNIQIQDPLPCIRRKWLTWSRVYPRGSHKSRTFPLLIYWRNSWQANFIFLRVLKQYGMLMLEEESIDDTLGNTGLGMELAESGS